MAQKNSLEVYSRELIYELVWSKAMKHAGPELGISDVALRKICLKHRIPVPPQGYWAKKAAGHDCIRPVLKPVSEKRLHEVRINKGNYDQSESMTRNRVKTIQDEQLRKLIAYEEQSSNRIVVPDAVPKPHPAIRATRHAQQIPGDRSPNLKKESKWYRVRLSVDVSNDCYPRAERILQGFIQAFISRGYELKVVPGKTSHLLRFAVCDELFDLKIREALRMIRPSAWTGTEADGYRPKATFEHKGELWLILSHHDGFTTRTWKDGPSQRIESVLNNVVTWMYLLADRQKKWRAERHQEQENLNLREEQRREDGLRRERDAQNIQQLLKLGESLRTAEALRRLMDVLQRRCDQLPTDDSQRSKLSQWLSLAEPYIQHLEKIFQVDALPEFVTRESQENPRRWNPK